MLHDLMNSHQRRQKWAMLEIIACSHDPRFLDLPVNPTTKDTKVSRFIMEIMFVELQM